MGMSVYTKSTKVLFTGLILLSMLFFSGLSCQETTPAPAQSPPTPSPGTPKEPTSAPPPVEKWTPDGIIGSGEYLGEMSYSNGNYEIYWASDEQNIYVGIKAKTSGWVAMAVQPGSRMKDADMVFGFVQDGEVTILDLFSTGDFGPHPPDTEQGGTDDIIAFGGKEEEDYTIIEFKRALDTGDQYDIKLSGGKNQIIWAYGSNDSLNIKHSNRGYGEINLPPR